MARYYTYCFTLFAVITIAFPSISAAQSPEKSNKGKDFWFSFLPNFHAAARAVDPAISLRDSLYVYITCDIATQGTITTTNRQGISRQIHFQITDPKKAYTYAVAWQGYELEGWNNHGVQAPDSINQCQRIALQSFRVVANDDIAVFALNQADRTSDAFLVLPTASLGLEYRVMSYQSDGFLETPTSTIISTTSTPSEFAVTAVHDSTRIIIYPTAETSRYRTKIDTVILMQGQSYLVQASITRTNLRGDLTGSKIIATKPVAVFSGHQRALVPVELRLNNTSRDCIIEQMPPVNTWGKNAFLASYPNPPRTALQGSDLFRVLAAFDNTDIFLGGAKLQTLQAGQYYTGNLKGSGFLTASKPILVAQYKKSAADVHTTGGDISSDPMMMILPSKEQFLPSYRFINAQATQLYSGQPPTPMFTAQYAMVVAPVTTLSTVRLDGNVVSADSFQQIPPSNYMLATLQVGDGMHTLEASEPIGVYVFGYGLVNSYGYVAGMKLADVPTTVEEQPTEDTGSIRISPNPALSSVNISGVQGVTSLRVVNYLGEMVIEIPQEQIGNSEHEINVSGLASGLYVIQIRTATGVISKQIVVHH